MQIHLQQPMQIHLPVQLHSTQMSCLASYLIHFLSLMIALMFKMLQMLKMLQMQPKQTPATFLQEKTS